MLAPVFPNNTITTDWLQDHGASNAAELALFLSCWQRARMILMPVIKVPQKNKTIQVEAGSNLMKSLLAAEVPVASSCNGDGICAKCRVRVTEGLSSLAKPNDKEEMLFEKFILKPDQRISCQVTVVSDIAVETTYW